MQAGPSFSNNALYDDCLSEYINFNINPWNVPCEHDSCEAKKLFYLDKPKRHLIYYTY